MEITVSFLGIHNWEPDIYIGFSPALHLQCRQQPLGNQQEGSRQPDRLQVNRNMQVAKQALGSQEEVTMQAAIMKAHSIKLECSSPGAGWQATGRLTDRLQVD